MRCSTSIFVLLILSFIQSTDAQTAAERPNEVRGDEINEAQQAAVDKGLAWLASRQGRNGSFGAPSAGYGAHVGISSLGGIALMSAGNLPGRGQYGEHVQRCVDFILASSQESGLLAS